MKSKTVKALLLLGIAIAPSIVNAASAHWYENVSLANVVAGPASARIAIYADADASKTPPLFDLTGCPSGGGLTSHAEFTLDRNSAYFKEIYSMIMIAYSTGKSISLYNDGTCSPYGLVLSDVRLNK